MDIKFSGSKVIISGMDHFSLEQCLCCGQAFRWRSQGEGFIGVALGREIYAQQNGDTLTIAGVDKEQSADFIRYFDLERDYGAIKASYSGDPFLREGMEYAGGIRVLRQPPFETLISFIISQNNNVKRISGIIETICKRYGKPVGGSFDFPAAETLADLSVKELEECGTGYRAPYIVGTAKAVTEGFDLDGLAEMPYMEAREKLITLPGVGPKVADCAALYSLGFTEAFPADVWMKRVLKCVYGFHGSDAQMREFVSSKFGKYAGIAQQYLFHYARNNRCALQEE